MWWWRIALAMLLVCDLMFLVVIYQELRGRGKPRHKPAQVVQMRKPAKHRDSGRPVA